SEIVTLEMLEDDVRDGIAVRADVEDLGYMLATKARRCAGLTKEVPDGFRVARELGAHELERHAAIEAHVLGAKHDTHPARADALLDAVFACDHIADVDRERLAVVAANTCEVVSLCRHARAVDEAIARVFMARAPRSIDAALSRQILG